MYNTHGRIENRDLWLLFLVAETLMATALHIAYGWAITVLLLELYAACISHKVGISGTNAKPRIISFEIIIMIFRETLS